MHRNIQGELSRFSFDLYDLLEEAKSIVPGVISSAVSIWILGHASLLAFIEIGDVEKKIVLHPLLNHPDTPLEVIRFILIHELIHIVIPSVEIEGRQLDHPDSFWALEKQLVPERALYWAWMYIH